jgi:hypothetical protein
MRAVILYIIAGWFFAFAISCALIYAATACQCQ